ncbi:hypothetical protein J4455_05230 [Candidatus Woesearchaeota archaeon]|nr:hypothetical protein [Candidatus Woesearchaeota archaeon]
MKKEAMKMKGNGMACQYCGSTNCKCPKMEMLLWGVIALVLGILLWMKTLTLEMTIAIALILKGLFMLMLGAKMKR